MAGALSTTFSQNAGPAQARCRQNLRAAKRQRGPEPSTPIASMRPLERAKRGAGTRIAGELPIVVTNNADDKPSCKLAP